MNFRIKSMILFTLIFFGSCAKKDSIKVAYYLTADQKHNKFSKSIPPVISVSSGAVSQAETNEASDGQLHKDATLDDLMNIDFDPIHPLTGQVYVESAEVGDVLALIY